MGPLSELVCERDYAGMSPMHMAARKHRLDWLKTMATANDKLEVFDQVTYTTSKPNSWSILHCALDQFSVDTDEANLCELCKWLMRSMSRDTLAHQTGSNGQNFVHFLAARGQVKLGYALVTALHTEIGATRTQEILNATDKKGRGTVDMALKCNVDFSDMLKKFHAKEQLPNPASGQGQERHRMKRAEWAKGYDDGWRDASQSKELGWKWTEQSWAPWKRQHAERQQAGGATGSDQDTGFAQGRGGRSPSPPPQTEGRVHGAGRW